MKLIALAFILFTSERSIEYTNSEQSITVKLTSKADKNSQTIIVFPEEALRTIISGWKNDEISAISNANKLFLRLLKTKQGVLDVIGNSGNLYRLNIEDVDSNPDSVVRIEEPKELKQSKVTAIELMKAMRLGKILKGAKISKCKGSAITSLYINVIPLYEYTYGFYKGYILKMQNPTDSNYEIDISKFRGDKLLLIGTTSPTLGPKQKGYVFCVLFN